jgi:hypothetical protein
VTLMVQGREHLADNATGADAGPQRPSLLAAVSRAGVRQRLCGVCGANYEVSNEPTPVLAIDVNAWDLDVGGYCPQCLRYVCPKHVLLAPHGNIDVLGEQQVYARKCATCQSAVVDEAGDDPDESAPRMFVAVGTTNGAWLELQSVDPGTASARQQR